MEKEQLLMKLMEITGSVRPKKGGRHKHRQDESEVCKADKEDREKKHKDPLRMPPSAKSVLTILLKEKKLNQRTLAKNTNITAQGISDMLKKLEKDELIIKETGNAYNENFIELTSKGEELAIEIKKQTKAHAEKMFQNLTMEELAALESILEKISQNNSNDESL